MLVGTVARITYDKDLPTFYEVARRVNARCPHVRFAIVGDGYGNELEDATADVRRLGLNGKVHLTGHRNDLKDVYASFDLFLMTSRTEGMPNAVLEAMALGLPVVSTRVGGVPELVVDTETGILCPPGDAASLADAVCRLLEDEKLREQFAEAARRRIEEKFDFAARVRTMEEIYTSFAHKGF
jgi:glycosyltransferase involved in cell wall biosynthesis